MRETKGEREAKSLEKTAKSNRNFSCLGKQHEKNHAFLKNCRRFRNPGGFSRRLAKKEEKDSRRVSRRGVSCKEAGEIG